MRPHEGSGGSILTVRHHQRIRSAGEVELVGDLYLPAAEPPHPAIFEVTPYGARHLARLGQIYAARGYLFLGVDARGRYRSEGRWEPMLFDRVDGHAVIRWLSEHPACDGRVGSRGHSYGAYSQMMWGVDAPDALEAMVVGSVRGRPFEDGPFRGGACDLLELQRLLSTAACDARLGPAEDFGEGRFGSWSRTERATPEEYAAQEKMKQAAEVLAPGRQASPRLMAALKGQPVEELDVRLGCRHDVFREWIRHWELDGYWRARSPGDRVASIEADVLFLTGWWDENGRGAPRFYSEMMRGRGVGREVRLVVGAWSHDERAPDTGDLHEEEAGLIERAARRDSLVDEFAWFDWRLKGIEPGPATEGRVSLFVTGAYRWVDLAGWPPPQSRLEAWHLHASGDLVAEGSVTERHARGYRFDPADPTPWGPDWASGRPHPFDVSALAARDDVLSYVSAPLEAALSVMGEVDAVIWAVADAPDFDVHVKLLDIYPDGRAIFLTDGVRRARFWEGWSSPGPAPVGSPLRFEVDLGHVGHVFGEDHRVGLHIGSAGAGRYDVNPCSGEPMGAARAAREVEVQILSGGAYASHIVLPVVAPRYAGVAGPTRG